MSDMKKGGFESIESEIRKEKAEALGRAGERPERALQELLAFRRESPGLVAAVRGSLRGGEERFPADVEQKLAEYARLWEQARELRHSLIIQREALSLWRREDVDRQYPLPSTLTPPTEACPVGDR